MAAIVACWIDLDLPSRTLKEKRSIVKSILRRVQRQFNVSVAEVDLQDLTGSAVIGLVTVSSSVDYSTGLMEKAVRWIEEQRLDAVIVEYHIEVL